MTKLPGDEVPSIINLFPFFIFLTNILSTFGDSDQALSSIGKSKVVFLSTMNLTLEFFL